MNVRAVVFGLGLVLSTQVLAGSPDLKGQRLIAFESRVEAQLAVEQVRLRHVTGDARSPDPAALRRAAATKVENYLRQTAALEQLWKVAITADMLRHETERIARDSRLPRRLQEIYAALGNDTVLFQECVARPTLVQRLIGSRYAESQRSVESVPKVPFDTWWKQNSDSFATDVPQVALPMTPPPFQPNGACTDDTWVPSALDGPLEARSFNSAVWTGSEMIVWGGMHGSSPEVALGSGARYDPAIDAWTPISLVGAPSPRGEHSAIWTGSKMIVWGGRERGWPGVNTGARYNPVTDTWSPMSDVGIDPRYGHTAVWTGTEMIVWGGFYIGGGGRYSPQTDTWHPLPTQGAPDVRAGFTTVWTGSEMIVWGGADNPGQLRSDGFRYDPSADCWRPTSNANAPFGKVNHSAVWTGSKMIVWGGGEFYGVSSYGASYDPVTDQWQWIADAGSTNRRVRHVALWTGTRMLVIGGDPYLSTRNSYLAEYDPGADQWVQKPWPDLYLGQSNVSAVWTGTEAIVWGGGSGAATYLGARYDPSTGTWLDVAGNEAPHARSGGTSVWSGNELLLWGGKDASVGYVDWPADRFDATLGTWSRINTGDQPDPRREHVAIWNGSEMIVWGGVSSQTQGVRLNTGARYDPITDSWAPTSTLQAPSARSEALAVWSGSEMLVWGGFRSGYLSSGARYNPTNDTWVPISTTGAPAARFGTSLVWAEGRMLLWGGYVQPTGPVNDGKAYDPSTNAWSPISTDGAPSPRRSHNATVAQGRMIIWSGLDDVTLASGGIYDPRLDQWSPMSSVGGPPGTVLPAVVGTDRELIVWGGYNSGDPAYPDGRRLDVGGRYDLEHDTWRPMSGLGRPLGRAGAFTAWTGTEMLVWGGRSSIELNTGGTYQACPAVTHPPVAAAGPDQVVECTGPSGATVLLDASESADPDADIASYLWSENGGPLADTATASVDFALGPHAVTLAVTDAEGAADTDETEIVVQDTTAPAGSITSPPPSSCSGLPVIVLDNYADTCASTLLRAYDPSPGPTFSTHGDHHVTLMASDPSGNAASSSVDFTIDTIPPVVTLLSPMPGISLPASIPLAVLFQSTDADGATGDIVHETISLQGCLVYDGATFGNHDGQLHDETIVITPTELCRVAAICGFTELNTPELRVAATDCGGNVGSATARLAGRVALNPWNCGTGLVPKARGPVKLKTKRPTL